MNKSLLLVCTFLFMLASCGQPNQKPDTTLMNYWDNKLDSLIEQDNRMLVEQAFSEYLNLFAQASDDSIGASIHHLMKEAEKDSLFYMRMAMIAERYLFERNSPQMNEGHYIHFLQAIEASGKMNKAHKFRYTKQLEGCLKNRPGNKAANIVFIDVQGNESSLYELPPKPMLLVFYSPRCNKCHTVIEQLKQDEQIGQWIKTDKLQVLSIYADGDSKEWENEKNHLPSAWINGYDYKDEIYMKGTYMLRMTPTIYLLDGNKNVLLKDTNLEEVMKYIHEYI